MFESGVSKNAAPFGVGYVAAMAAKEIGKKYGLALHEMDQLMLHLAALAKNGGKMNGVSAFTAFGAVKQAFDAMDAVLKTHGVK